MLLAERLDQQPAEIVLQMASQPDVLQFCLQEAAKAARPALERCVEEAAAALQTAETQSMKVAERDQLATASRELLRNKAPWSTRYPADLLIKFKANVAATGQAARAPAPPVSGQTTATPSASAFASLSPGSFSLVNDADVSQAIEAARLLQQVLPAVEQVLAELNTLVSTVQGLPNVRPDLNPLRPDVFAQALREMIFAAQVEPSIAALWIRHLAPPLGRELKRIYEDLVQQLERANVQGASYRVLQTPASAARTQSGGGNTGNERNAPAGEQFGSGTYPTDGQGAGQPSQYADLSSYEIRDALFQDFLLHGGSHADRGLAPSYYETVDRELAALRESADPALDSLPGFGSAPQSDYSELAAVDRPPRAVDEGSELDPQIWGAYGRPRERALVRTRLKREATRVAQALGLEVVRKLVKQVAQDPRLLVPVRQAIVALEPSLLRLALVDPRFFSDENHAGRRLMERVAQRSFKYNDEFSPEFLDFFGPLSRAFNELNALTIDHAQPFGKTLAVLEDAWDEQDQRELENRNKMLHALRFAEDRQSQADQIAFELSKRSDLEKVPGIVLDFLFGPWALAMAHARLADTRKQVDPEGFGSVVPDLLWSVKQDVTLKQPAKLIEMIPSLLGKLHAGLELLGQDPRENEAFFEGLMNLHRPVLKLRRLKNQQDGQESGALALEPEELAAPPEQRLARIAAHPWLARNELDAAGFEDTLPSTQSELVALHDEDDATEADPPGAGTAEVAASNDDLAQPEVALPAPGRTMTHEEAEQILFGLRSGRWVDLYSRRRWLRAQLIWASTKGTLFMFVSHGGQPHSMTQRSCERLISERLLRPVETHGVVAHALDQLARETSPTEA